ncbi:hypothetical protein QP516_07745 [Micrococcus luteus]|uniref:hypothetical protein n=1 Tax=Micrococcus luteus TaxID=1270 RepID=UPI00215310E9|nr:hypothetical protein [Micrococcus luteus]MDK7329669.1 hypothetical protein [Micrococcus luteus]
MVTSSLPLPDIAEAGRPFTRGDLRAAGVSERLVRGADVRRVTHGVHRLRSDHLGSWADLGYVEAPAPFAPEETAAIELSPG